MAWDLEFGPSIEKLQALRDAGKPVPALDRRPFLPATLEWVWEAFAQLHHTRPMHGGVIGAIPLQEIKAYADLRNLDHDEIEELLSFIRLLDRQYLDHAAQKAEKNAKASSSGRRQSGKVGRRTRR